MFGTERILAAREALETLTPLRGDCGRTCGADCCHPDEEGNGGTMLFPSEEALHDPCPDWARLVPSADFSGQYLFTCDGRCDRAARPLACRIFPLTPRVREGKVIIEPDVRAWPVCPLMECSLNGLSGAFVKAVREAMESLAQDEACLAYMKKLSEYLEQFETL